MNNEAKISVVIPTYNKAQYLREAIESVLNQTYKKIEVIIIDDGSTDRTQEIVKSFDNPRITYFWQENTGPSAARNTGIKKSQGKYLAFLDSDDLWLKEKLEKQVDFMEKNPEVGLLGTGCYEINHQGEIMGKKIFPTENKILQKILIRYNPFIQSSIAVRREIFDEVGLYDENFRQSEDYEICLRVAKNCKIGNLPEPLTMKRYYKENLSPTKDKEQLYFTLKAKRNAFSKGKYPGWCYIYVLKSYFALLIPFRLRKIIRQYFLKKKFYKLS